MDKHTLLSHPLYGQVEHACRYGKWNHGKYHYPAYYGYPYKKPTSLTAHWNQWKKDCLALLKADKIEECQKLLNCGDTRYDRHGYEGERKMMFVISHYDAHVSKKMNYPFSSCRDDRLR